MLSYMHGLPPLPFLSLYLGNTDSKERINQKRLGERLNTCDIEVSPVTFQTAKAKSSSIAIPLTDCMAGIRQEQN